MKLFSVFLAEFLVALEHNCMNSTTSVTVNVVDLFARAQLSAGMHIADFGAGRTGHIVFPAAKMIGEHGVVYAVDILPDVLAEIKKRADLASLLQIKPVWADIESPQAVAIPGQSLDAVFLVNILHTTVKPKTILTEADRLLKNKGRLIIVDWSTALGIMTPKKGEFLDFEQIISWAREQHYAIQEDFSVSNYTRGLILFKHA